MSPLPEPPLGLGVPRGQRAVWTNPLLSAPGLFAPIDEVKALNLRYFVPMLESPSDELRFDLNPSHTKAQVDAHRKQISLLELAKCWSVD